jgi:hypothetical protein
MGWDARRSGDFTTGELWLPIGGGVAQRNVGTLQSDPGSLLSLYAD